MKKIIAMVLSLALVLGTTACAGKPAASTPPESGKPEASSPAAASAKETYEFAFVIPGTDSQYWNQYCGTGAQNAVKDLEAKYGIKINLTTYGPSSEGETDKYLSILEGVIAKKPDAIITATMQPDGTAPLVKQAKDQGIFVSLFTLGITGEEDSYGSFYYCDQPQQGVLAAEAMVKQMEAKGIEKKGIVGVHLATLVPVLLEKMDQFKSKMNELCPEIEVLEIVYNENDVNKAQSNVENQIATYGDKLVGLFGGNNLSGDGIVLAVKNAGISAKVATVAVDSDDIEIQGLKDGTLDAIVVQTPYEQAYKATYNAYEASVLGIKDEKMVNIPADVVTKSNMEEEKYAALLNPLLLAK